MNAQINAQMTHFYQNKWSRMVLNRDGIIGKQGAVNSKIDRMP